MPASQLSPQTDTRPENDAVQAYIARARAEKPTRKTRAAGSPWLRRLSGLIFGAVFGLLFGAISQLVNPMRLPGIELVVAPFNPLGNTVVIVLSAAMVGLACAWPGGWSNGVVAGCVGFLGVLEVRAWLVPGAISLLRNLLHPVGLGFAVLQIAVQFFFLIPISTTLRWAIESEIDWRELKGSPFKRLRAPLVLALLAGLAGFLLLFPKNELAKIRHMDQMIRSGLSAKNDAELPVQLQADSVEGFLRYGVPSFTLQYDHSLLYDHRFSPLELSRQDRPVPILARFENGYLLLCIYTEDIVYPSCQSALPVKGPVQFSG